MATYSPTSPYYQTQFTNGYLDVINFIDIPVYSDDPYYTLTAKYMHRPDLLAYDLYNDVSLWWVFAVRNKDVIKDPVYDMVPGLSLFLPKTSTIKTALGIY